VARKLYELCGADPERRFSPYCWRSRMALAHKGLEAEVVPWRFTETEALAFAQHDKVPVLVDGDVVVPDSWAIAQYLDTTYPDRPPLLHGRPAGFRFIIAWTDTVLTAGVARLIVSDIPPLLRDKERAYFVESREKRFGMALEAVTADREARLPAFRASLQPLRAITAAQPFLGGEEPDYGDYIVFGSFMWARTTSPLRLLEADDAVYAWRERMLDLYGGLARRVPCFSA
jgi:glutathione S-transferase